MSATVPGLPPRSPHFSGLPARRAHFLQALAGMAPTSDAATGQEDALRAALGFVPPCRGPASPETLESSLRALHEQLRTGGLKPDAIDIRTVHLLLTALLLTEHGAAAVEQGMVARRAGVSRAEVEAVAALVFATHGLAGVARGDEFLTALAEREREERVAGAVAAYG
jgi:hypothetical protein